MYVSLTLAIEVVVLASHGVEIQAPIGGRTRTAVVYGDFRVNSCSIARRQFHRPAVRRGPAEPYVMIDGPFRVILVNASAVGGAVFAGGRVVERESPGPADRRSRGAKVVVRHGRDHPGHSAGGRLLDSPDPIFAFPRTRGSRPGCLAGIIAMSLDGRHPVRRRGHAPIGDQTIPVAPGRPGTLGSKCQRGAGQRRHQNEKPNCLQHLLHLSSPEVPGKQDSAPVCRLRSYFPGPISALLRVYVASGDRPQWPGCTMRLVSRTSNPTARIAHPRSDQAPQGAPGRPLRRSIGTRQHGDKSKPHDRRDCRGAVGAVRYLVGLPQIVYAVPKWLTRTVTPRPSLPGLPVSLSQRLLLSRPATRRLSWPTRCPGGPSPFVR